MREFTARGIRLSEPELFVPFSYPVWPHPENRKPRMCQCAQWRYFNSYPNANHHVPKIRGLEARFVVTGAQRIEGWLKAACNSDNNISTDCGRRAGSCANALANSACQCWGASGRCVATGVNLATSPLPNQSAGDLPSNG